MLPTGFAISPSPRSWMRAALPALLALPLAFEQPASAQTLSALPTPSAPGQAADAGLPLTALTPLTLPAQPQGQAQARGGMRPQADFGAADAAAQPHPQQASQARPPRPAVVSQFQRFVQESTGRLLQPFGMSLFENPQAYAADTAAPAPSEYVLGPGDEVRLQIWGAVDYSGSHTLDRNGQVSLPKIGTFSLAGTQVKDLETSVRKQVATVFTNVNVNASLGRLRGITVYVVGQAQQPGAYTLHSLSTLVNAVFASGGPTTHGSMREIRLQRAGQTVATLDLYDFIARGDKRNDARLQPGDVITIPPAGPRVALTGATDHAAIYELRTGNTLRDVLALGGGVPVLARTQKALVETIKPGNPRNPREVIELSLEGQGQTQPLRDGDIVTLLPLSPAFGNTVTLPGAVAQPLRHRWSTGMRVLDLIPEREALVSAAYYRRKNQLVQNVTELPSTGRSATALAESAQLPNEQINWEYAVIERMDAATLRTELIPFNLGKAVIDKDPAYNLPLQPGDVVTVMSSSQIRLPVSRQSRLVRVEGEVAAPGIYQAMPGETLPQLVQRIGGVTPQAYLFGTEFSRESVRKTQQQNLDQLVRKLEAQLQNNSATVAANLTGDRAANAAALQQAQQAQAQAQINRLRNLRSQGRVSLELDPSTAVTVSAASLNLEQVLPALPLEDGDSVLIPPAPAFVAAMGSVHNENVFIHKPGKTVGEVIQSAGLTEDAELSEAFVLRADGSIIARKSKGFFGSFESAKVLPGDTLVVPAMMDRESRYNFIVRALRDWTQIFSNLGLGAAAIRTLRN